MALQRRLDTFSFRRDLRADRTARPVLMLRWSEDRSELHTVYHTAWNTDGDRVGCVYSHSNRLFSMVTPPDFSSPARVLPGSHKIDHVGLASAKAALEAAVAAQTAEAA